MMSQPTGGGIIVKQLKDLYLSIVLNKKNYRVCAVIEDRQIKVLISIKNISLVFSPY